MKTALFIAIVHEPKRGKAREDYYVLTRTADDYVVQWAFRKLEGETRTVTIKDNARPTCDCQDFTMVKQAKHQNCKHIDSLIERGILPQKKPVAAIFLAQRMGGLFHFAVPALTHSMGKRAKTMRR